jgi:hypothetical protein
MKNNYWLNNKQEKEFKAINQHQIAIALQMCDYLNTNSRTVAVDVVEQAYSVALNGSFETLRDDLKQAKNDYGAGADEAIERIGKQQFVNYWNDWKAYERAMIMPAVFLAPNDIKEKVIDLVRSFKD